MNYIRHLSSFYEKVMNDQRLNPTHISLYHALFQCWNMNRFQNPVIIYREQTMRLSHLGSLHTYYKCLYDLHNWGYITYKPSHSPKNGSEVYLYNFDTSLPKDDTGLDAKMEQAGCKSDISLDAKVHPYINNINIKTYREGDPQAQNPEIENTDGKNEKAELAGTGNEKRKKVAPKKEKGSEEDFVPPTLDEALAFFKTEQYPELEARKFFFHFESNGWKVGGKSPMKNWQAAAHNWMLNVPKYDTVQKSNAVKLNSSKDYGEPL